MVLQTLVEWFKYMAIYVSLYIIMFKQ